MELTQGAYNQYLDAELDNDQKRNILTKLFDSVVYEHNSVSVKYSYFAESVAQKSNESRKILGGQNMLNQTNKNDLINRGQTVENFENSPLFPVWQGLQDGYQTYCGIVYFFNENYMERITCEVLAISEDMSE